MSILALLDMNKDTIFKICIGVAILIGVIIVFCFIRKHKGVCITIFTVLVLIVAFYFLNSFLGFHFTNDLSRDSIRTTYDDNNYITLEYEDTTIYYRKAFDENGKLINSDGDFFAVEKVMFFYKEKKSTTYEYEITIEEISLNPVNLIVKEIRADDKYFYSFSLDFVSISDETSYLEIENYYLNNITFNNENYEIDNLFFFFSDEKITDLEVNGNVATKKIN